MQRVQACTR